METKISTSMKKFKNVKSKVRCTCTCSVHNYATILPELSQWLADIVESLTYNVLFPYAARDTDQVIVSMNA